MLFLAPGTIKHHMLELYDKLEAPTAPRRSTPHGASACSPIIAPTSPAAHPAVRGVRVLVADRDDVRRTGLLLALHGGVGARTPRTRWRSPRVCGRRSRWRATPSCAAP